VGELCGQRCHLVPGQRREGGALVPQQQQPAAAGRGKHRPHRLNVSTTQSKLVSERAARRRRRCLRRARAHEDDALSGNAFGAALAAPRGGAGSAARAAASARDGGDAQRSCSRFLAELRGGSRLAGVGAPKLQQHRAGAAGGQLLRARSRHLGLEVMQGPVDAAAEALHGVGALAGCTCMQPAGAAGRLRAGGFNVLYFCMFLQCSDVQKSRAEVSVSGALVLAARSCGVAACFGVPATA